MNNNTNIINFVEEGCSHANVYIISTPKDMDVTLENVVRVQVEKDLKEGLNEIFMMDKEGFIDDGLEWDVEPLTEMISSYLKEYGTLTMFTVSSNANVFVQKY